MIYQTHQASEALSKYLVDIIYIKDHYPDHDLEKYLPDGTTNIIFELTGHPKYIYDNTTKTKIQECTDVWFSGVLRDHITISAESEEMMVVVFKPGAGYPLTHQSADLTANTVVQADTIFGPSILKLHAQLKQSETPEDKFQAIETWLSHQFKADDFYTEIIQNAIKTLQEASVENNISELAKASGYSQKQFIQLFKKYVGITPKQLHRITRFNEILSAVEPKERLSWTKIAADCGYFDQAHFIKDFQSFSGLNPKDYLKDIGDYPNFFPVK